jgi:hypothetical protein
MEQIRYLADVSIRRACGFGLMAICTALVGVASDAMLVFKMAAICSSAMAAILVIKAIQAPARNYRRTEVWLMLDKKHDLPESAAQRVFGSILQERYMWHATITASAAGVLWLVTLFLAVFKQPPLL